MTQVLITGATGKVGNAVARPLVARGEAVRALLRDPVAARASLPGEVELLAGDVVDREACRRAVAGVEAVFISHGIYEQWVCNLAIFDAVNAAGAENVAVAAREAGVARIVHTSTYDVFDADRNGHLDERQLATAPKQTPYERSKQRAEELGLAAAGAGTEVVIVNPGMVYGPGPWASAGLDASLLDCLSGRLPGVPRGAGLAFVDAVAAGHVAALERGVAGERYVLAGPYVALIDFFRRAVELAGRGRVPMQVPPAVAPTTTTRRPAQVPVMGRRPRQSQGRAGTRLRAGRARRRARADGRLAAVVRTARRWQAITPSSNGIDRTGGPKVTTNQTRDGDMVVPNPNRIGGLEWARRTRGKLTAAERRRLLGAIAVTQAVNVFGRVKLALGRLPDGASSIDVRDFQPPDSRLAREAEAACAEQLDLLVAHSYRTWMWGMALATLDREPLDRELFYCAALVHDWGATVPVPGEDFTIRGAERALACARAAGIDPARADLIADGICCHTTPGVTVERDGPIAYYVQYGAMVDGAGLRAWDVAPHNIEEVLRRHPRGPAFKRGLSDTIRDEARAVPGGRFGLARRCGMTLAVQMAPFDT